MAKAIESQGVTLYYSQGGSPTSFVALGNVTAIRGPGGQAPVIDVSNLASTFREKLMGLPDEGQITLDVNLDPDNSGHTALRTNRANRTLTEFKLTLTDSTPAYGIFFAYVTGFSHDIAVGQQVKVAVTLEIDGAVSWA
jgi:hypothetical protein